MVSPCVYIIEEYLMTSHIKCKINYSRENLFYKMEKRERFKRDEAIRSKIS